MTQEDKELLLKDLCARLPYGVICTDLRHGDSKITEVNTEDGLVYCHDFDEYIKVEDCRLYLRPMSSMTGKERMFVASMSQFNQLTKSVEVIKCCYPILNYCYTKHLDINGLIEKGLALEAKEGMYETD